MKIGIIGAGYMGGMHAACYEALAASGVTVSAVADFREENAAALAAGFGAKVYGDGFELIEVGEVDAVDICLPTYLHTKYAVAAMKKGLPVFVEKPLCLNGEEAELLLKTEREAKVPVMVGQCLRLWSEYAWLKRIHEEGCYGTLVSGVFKRISPRPEWAWNNWLHKPECSGTAALDMHIHDVDFVRYLLGEPVSFTAAAGRDRDGVIQQIFSTYDYPDTAVTIEACWDYPKDFPFTMEYRVKFEKATVVFCSSATPALSVYPIEGGCLVPELLKEFESENKIGGNVSSLAGYYNELKYFTEGLAGHKELTVATLEDAARSVALVLDEIKAAGGVKKSI